MGTPDLVREQNPTDCYAMTGIQQRINPGWNNGAILQIITFSGLNKGYDCGEKGFEFYYLLKEQFYGKQSLIQHPYGGWNR